MASYRQFCPVAMAAQVVTERWTPLIVRELLLGSRRFGEILHGVPGMPRSVLTSRLLGLERAGVLRRLPALAGHGHEYELTDAGRELGPVIEALGAWGYRHAVTDLPADTLDPSLFLWFARRRLALGRVPPGRIVIQFDFRAVRGAAGASRSHWLVIDRPSVEVCLVDPGYDVDLIVSAETETLARVYLGHVDLAAAVADGRIEIDGRRDLARGLPGWFGTTHFVRYRDQEPGPRFGD